jgi:hypothetical protein
MIFPGISSFPNSDPSFIAMVDTLLESRVTGVGFDIRTECFNGAAFPFPVLTLCLDGLPRVVEKHELAKKMMNEAIASEGGDPGILGRLVYNLPTATTGVFSVDASGEELDELKRKMKAGSAEELLKLKDELEAEYAEKMKQPISENSQLLGKLEQKQETSKF